MATYITQKIPNTKSTITVPSWVRALEDNIGLSDEANAYNYVPLIFKATNLRCNAMAATPLRILRGEKEIEWPFKTGLRQLLWKTEAAMLLKGSAFWLKRANKVMVKDIQWLNPFAMDVKFADGRLTFQQNMEGGQEFTEDDIVYFHEFAPTDDLTSGTSPTSVAMGNSKLLKYMTDYAAEFFRNGAMPTTIVHVPQGTSDTEKERVQNFFARSVSGIRRAFRVIALSGGQNGDGVSVNTITPNISELAMPELKAQALEAIAHAFQIPETMLTDAANYATAKEHRMSFYQDTIRPRAEIFIAETINRQLLNEKNMELQFAFDEMDIFQEDEKRRSWSFVNYVSSGMKPSIAAQILGIDLPDEYDPAYDLLDEGWQAKQEADIINTDMQPKQVQDELQKWLRFELRRVGKDDKREFKCEFTPAALVGAIQGALETAKTDEAIKAIFRDAKRWESYP